MRPNRARRWLNKWSRKLHRWGSVATAVPLLIVLVTGILLLLKKDVAWIQPPTAAGPAGPPAVAFDEILAAVVAVPEADAAGWADIDRLDVRPGEGVAKVQCVSGYEVQVSTVTGEVLQTARRRSDLIESLHDGSWFHGAVKLGVFLPSAVIVLALWITGAWLWLMPHLRSKRRPKAA
ncbi:MAG: PepSY domain-containing protein [Phycisphaerales bacterium JB054]